MKIIVEIPDAVVEGVVKSILDNYPEAGNGNSIKCVEWRYDEWTFKFHDEETGKNYTPSKAQLLNAFPLIFTDKWPKGCTKPPFTAETATKETFDEWLCQCDATDFDAFIQLVCLGEVIYG